LRDAGRVPKPGQRWTVASWLTQWIENIAIPPHVSENTHAGYRVYVLALGRAGMLVKRPSVVPGHGGGGCEIRTREGLPPTRFPSLWACVRDRSAWSVAWSCGLVRSSADGLEPRRMRPELRPARPRPQWFSRAFVAHSLPSLLPALSALGAGSPRKIIPRISRGCCQPLPGERAADGLRGPRPVAEEDVGGRTGMLMRSSGTVGKG
jgi:hypothetical protein